MAVDSFADMATNLGAASEADELKALISDQLVANSAAGANNGGGNGARKAVSLEDVGADLSARHGGKADRASTLPNADVATDQADSNVPESNGARKVECTDNTDHTKGVPCLQKHVTGALGLENLASDGTRKADSQITDVNGFLNLTNTLGVDFPISKETSFPRASTFSRRATPI